VGKTNHNVGGLACILGLTNPHNQSPWLPRNVVPRDQKCPPTRVGKASNKPSVLASIACQNCNEILFACDQRKKLHLIVTRNQKKVESWFALLHAGRGTKFAPLGANLACDQRQWGELWNLQTRLQAFETAHNSSQPDLAPWITTRCLVRRAGASCPPTHSFFLARPPTLLCENTVTGVMRVCACVARRAGWHSYSWLGVPSDAGLYLLNTDCLNGGQVHCGGSSRYPAAQRAGGWDAFQRVT